MQILGLHVGGSPQTVHMVIWDAATRAVIDTFTHVPSPEHDEATEAREARGHVHTSIKTFALAAAALREADYNARQRLDGPTKRRLRLEGACLTAARDKVDTVVVLNGAAIGRAFNSDKQAVLEEARTYGLPKAFTEALAAAMAAGRDLLASPAG